MYGITCEGSWVLARLPVCYNLLNQGTEYELYVKKDK